MKSKKIKQLLAVTLTATMLAQPVSAQIVFAEDAVNVEPQVEQQEQTEQQEQAEQQEQTEKQEQAVSPAAETTGAVLKNGTAVIPADTNADQLKQILGKALVANADQVDINSLEWEYYCTGKSGLSKNSAWGSVEGFTSSTKKIGIVTTYTHPSLAANTDGNYQVRLKGTTTEVTLTKAQKLTSAISTKEGTNVNLVYNEDGSVNYDAVRQNIFDTVVESTTPELTVNDVTIEYYATATTGSLGDAGKAWMPLEGGTSGTLIPLTYPAMGEGAQKIKISYAGTDTYFGASAEVMVNIGSGKEQSAFNLNEPAEGAASYEVPMAFNEDQTYDYDATAKVIYNAVVASTVPENLTADDVTIRYNAGTDLIKNWQPLNTTDWTSTFTKFGPGEWTIQFSWAGNKEYKGATTEVKVNVTDNRLASAIVCKEGVSFTYNMDAAVMKQAIFDNVIDWENSTLPAKDTLTVDNFTMEYFGSNTLAGDIDGGVKQWAPIEGGTVTLLTYAQMGAGEQKIRITYKGNAQYRPSAQTESTVTVNKAKVKVKVKSTSIYADATLPEDFVTMNPADKFDVYTVYGGLTSNANLSLYLDLPDKYTNSAVLKLLDPIVEKLYGKTFTQMMNDGMTVGELRQLLSTQELLDLLEKLHIDTGTFGQILTIINKMPSVADSVRVSFGTPNHAGLYTVTAVTDSKNYETGVGIGTLLVKMRSKGVKLNWNERFVNGKITAEEAKNFDFKATLSADGDVTIAQDNVHYLYSGFTSKWKIYSSTTTPPTEPGSYVMTVVTLGGDYQAAPITRGFKITK